MTSMWFESPNSQAMRAGHTTGGPARQRYPLHCLDKFAKMGETQKHFLVFPTIQKFPLLFKTWNKNPVDH